jgi:hypothetical protein
MQDVSEAVSEAVGTVLSEQETIVAEVEAEANANAEAEEAAPDTDDVIAESEEQVEVSDETEDEEAEASDAEETETETEEPEVEAASEEYVNVPVLNDELATSFTLFDAEGELEIPDVIVEYKANGKVRKDRLDKVVKLAQQRFSPDPEAQEKTNLVTQQRDQLEQQLIEREDQLVRLLQEDDYYYNAREAFSKENSPELRAERAEQKVRDMRVAQEMSQIENEGGKFWEAELEPAIGMLSDALPTVSSDELAQKCVQGIQQYMELAPNGQPYVPSHKFDAVREYILEDLAYWAQLQHSKRSESTGTAKDDAALKKLEKARVEAQKAKRLVGQKTKPVGRAGKARSPKKQRRAATVDDALDSALDSVLQHI